MALKAPNAAGVTGAARVVVVASAALPVGTAALAARGAMVPARGGMVPVREASVVRADPVARGVISAVRVRAAMPGGAGRRGSSGIRRPRLRGDRGAMIAGNSGRSR